MRWWLTVTALAGAVALGGCAGGSDVGKVQSGKRINAGSTAAPASPAPSAAGSPSRTQRSGPAGTRTDVRAATPAPEAMAGLGGKHDAAYDEEKEFHLGRVCSVDLDTKKIGTNNGFARAWDHDDWGITLLIVGNTSVKGTEQITAVRKAYGACKEYRDDDVKKTITGQFDLGAIPRIDASYAWTEQLLWDDGTKAAVCEAYVAYGNVVSWVTVQAQSASIATSICKKSTDIVAAQLTKG